MVEVLNPCLHYFLVVILSHGVGLDAGSQQRLQRQDVMGFHITWNFRNSGVVEAVLLSSVIIFLMLNQLPCHSQIFTLVQELHVASLQDSLLVLGKYGLFTFELWLCEDPLLNTIFLYSLRLSIVRNLVLAYALVPNFLKAKEANTIDSTVQLVK